MTLAETFEFLRRMHQSVLFLYGNGPTGLEFESRASRLCPSCCHAPCANL